MKKKWKNPDWFILTSQRKILMIMSLKLFFSFIVLCSVSANSFSQVEKVTIQMKESTLSKVFDEIESQTSYSLFYKKDVLDDQQIVTVDAVNTEVKDVLIDLFKGQNLSFKVVDNSIVIATPSLLGNERSPATQQTVTITGTVKDSQGAGIPTASVYVKGTTNGVLTDSDGNFSITVTGTSETLVVSFVGMKTLEIPIGTQTFFDIVLEDDAIGLNEVVITALGIEKEAKSLSYNVQQLNAAEINKVADASFINNLSGKVVGVNINSSSSGVGGSSRVIMRGMKSVNGNNNALFVIDGIPMPYLPSSQPGDVFSGAGQTGDGISSVNPDDIESISVLSGPSAAALYGSSAANGVVLITTKKGKKEQLSVSLSNSTMFSTPLVLPEFQNTYGQTEPLSYYSWGEKLNTPSKYKPSDFFQTGTNVTNTASISTGTEKSQTYASIGSVNSRGIIHSNNYDRYNFSVRNTSNFLNDKMTMDLGYMTSNVKEQNMISQGQYFNPLVPVYLFPAGDDFEKAEIFERYNASRNFKTQFWPYGDGGLSMQNPYWITERDKFINNKARYMTNASLKYKFADWINISGRIKIDKDNDRYEKKYSASTNTLFASATGYYSLNETETRQIYGEAILNINKYLYNNTLNVIANIGSNFEDIVYNQDMYGGKLAGVANLFTFYNVNSTTSEASQSGYHKKKRSVFASAQIGYKSLVYLDVTGRNDWVSTLANADNKSFFYPTVGLSGIITDIFPIKSDLMPYLKTRISYSEVGNEPALFLTIPTYIMSSGYPDTGLRAQNTDLNPELTKSWEAGVNMVFFKNRLKVDATVYKSSTYNQFFQPNITSSSGSLNVIVNSGRIDNKGIEASVKYNQSFGKLEWDSYLTYSLNRNKVIELLRWTNPVTNQFVSFSELNMGGTGSYQTILKEGNPMGDIYVSTLKTDEHGAIYVDPKDQTVKADPSTFVYAGNYSPKYNLSWGNNLSYKGISLSFLFSARVGGIVVSNTQAIMDAFGISKASADARDAGGALVNGKRIPAKEYYQTIGAGSSGGIGSMYCYSATNVRLSELTLGYDIPSRYLFGWVKQANVSFVSRNLFFLYRKAPYDPELTANTGTYFQGIDYFMQPSLRNLGFSVKLNF